MSRKIFEYYFDPEELDPYYSELVASLNCTKPRSARIQHIDRQDRTESHREKERDCRNSLDKQAAKTEVFQRHVPQEDKVDHSTKSNPAGSPLGSPRKPERVAENGAKDGEEVPDVGTESRRSRVRRLLSVHALGQYVFCARSAILSAERGDQREIDESLPRLTYLPNFDRERIEEMLSAKMKQFGFFVLFGFCLLVLMKMGLKAQSRLVFYPSVLGSLGLCFWSSSVVLSILELAMRRRAAIRAEALEPEPKIERIESVNWWSMLKAGFEPINYRRPFEHPELPLEGCPWRVLLRGSRRIPVIRSGSRQLGPRKGELYAKHQVRLVAYALLLESVDHMEVPYGLVFPVDSPRGLAFPITDELRDRAARLLDDFEKRLEESQRQQAQPQLPDNRNRCVHCDYGRPVPTTGRAIEQARKSGQQLVVLQHQSGNLFRCACADRFGSAPPHGWTIKEGLTAAVF